MDESSQLLPLKGLGFFCHAYPELKRWAILFRAYGARAAFDPRRSEPENVTEGCSTQPQGAKTRVGEAAVPSLHPNKRKGGACRGPAEETRVFLLHLPSVETLG
jgi:hypothetical protein